ncbi:LADA_0G11078g1_1 [Lachancea dasiensis]|uniref:HECT-type E3 ubiquitin transferase n=1 Tax=Lachancea dasiensis TaxID=1072105 RepID=A0A1G4JUX8_9SACH|nr:LADA_0G11078g1_1 [Lachancea dasiensis]
MEGGYENEEDFVIHANTSSLEDVESGLEESTESHEYEYPDEEEDDDLDGDEESLHYQDSRDTRYQADDGGEEESSFQTGFSDTDRQHLHNSMNRPQASLHQLLGFLSQGMEVHGISREAQADRGATTTNRHTRGVDIHDIFPEMFGFGGAGHSLSSNRSNGRITRLLDNVASCEEDPYMAQESLREISEQLLMMNSLTAERLVPQEELLTSIIKILKDPQLQEQLELQMIACRCLYNLFEVNPGVIDLAVDRQVITCLHAKLLEISYIDLAEQVLETLEVISKSHGREILEAGCMMACIQYLDFFTSHAQRKALTIVVNSCARIRTENFQQVADVMPTLKQVFLTHSDHTLLLRILDGLYGICSGFRKELYLLTKLFDYGFVERIMQLMINGETRLEARLKAFDILSQVAISSNNLATQIIASQKVMDVIMNSINDFKKTSKSPLHERIMFAPKSLLLSIARFLVLLLPFEDDPVFSIVDGDGINLNGIGNELKRLIDEITPIMIEIYVNTGDFQIRKLILIGLARSNSSQLPFVSTNIDRHVISMLASTFARQGPTFTESGFNDLESGALLLGCTSLARALIDKNPAQYLPAFRREGIFSVLTSILEKLPSHFDSGPSDELERREQEASGSDNEDLSEASIDSGTDGDYDMGFDEFEGVSQIKPRKIYFKVFSRLNMASVKHDLYRNLKKITAISTDENNSNIKDLNEIGSLVQELRCVHVDSKTYEYWVAVWNDVKNRLFSTNFTISSFEFISTGLAREMAKIIHANGEKNSICQRAMVGAFSDKVKQFIQILQAALTRIESFPVIDCGLAGEEGKAASLGKQVKIKLEYAGDAEEDQIPISLRSITIFIHCISSFKALNDFLKHRLLQSHLIDSAMPQAGVRAEEVQTLDKWDLGFTFEDKECPYHSTIFGSIFNPTADNSHFWNEIHVVKFKKMKDNVRDQIEDQTIGKLYTEEVTNNEKNPVYDILILLKTLSGCIEDESFVNSKISAKLARQLEEPLIVSGGCLPGWTLSITKDYPFLFPLDIRIFFLQSASYGYGRLIQIWKDRSNGNKGVGIDTGLHQLGRPTRHKLRVSRDSIFLSALKILSKYGSSPSILEIEFMHEVGTGLGPTMEFYAIVSREFGRRVLGLWRCDNYSAHEDNFVEGLLFPAPLAASKDHDRTLELYKQLGLFVARSMLDNRILDFRFNRAFFELAHLYAEEGNLDFGDTEFMLHLLDMVDPQLSNSLRFLLEHKYDDLIETLSLTFQLPGYNVELIPNGASIAVTKENFGTYFRCVLNETIGPGVENQIRSFMSGFSQTFPYRSLLILSPVELTELFGRTEEDWTVSTLVANVEADHGYTNDSETIRDLISLMVSFSYKERRLFLQFLTGSPKLPVGGFKSLNPKLTIVRKHTEGDLGPDHYLPSVMTCANYLKLPKYSNKNIMECRIKQAMKEGSGAFLLS